MKILNICAYTWAIGGPARIIYDHTTEAIKNGHQVDIASPMTPGERLYDLPKGARVIRCNRTTPISNFYNEFSLDLYSFLKKHIHEYDIIHIHGIWHFGSLAPFLIRNNVPKVITIHGLLDRWAINNSHWKKAIVSFLYQKRLLEKADLIQINNTDEEKDVIEYLGHEPRNMAIIPNGMQFRDYQELPLKGTLKENFHLPKDKKLVLFMGRLNIKKGLDLVLPAFKEYVAAHDDAYLVLAGPDDGYQKEVEVFIKEHNLQNSVYLVGMLTDSTKKSAMADADIFVLPSYSEGFSIAVLEAMICGVPALVSDRIGFGDYIKKYEAAHLCPLTIEGVKEGLTELLGSEAYRVYRSVNALKMVYENFDISVVAKKLLYEYQKIQPSSKN